jgi:cytosine deaminase
VTAPAHFPSSGNFVLKNASVPSAVLGQAILPVALQRLDVTIADGVIAAIAPAGSAPIDGESYDLDAGLLLPAFVDVHTHLDKGHIWPRKANPDGTFMGALLAVAEDRETNWSGHDVERRMDFALRCAYAHGTAAIRTHLDSAPPQHEITWDIFETVRERWAGKIELQAVALLGPDLLLHDSMPAVARRAQAAGGRLGGAIADYPEARRAIFAAVDLAGRLGMDIDLHCDETLERESSALRHLADAVIETGFTGRALAGHCCVLSVQDEETARATIERVAEAGVSIVSLPMCNMYLQDRDNADSVQTPRFRGVTLVNEFKAAGVPVALASDNTRDPFYAYGDLDPLEVLREGARITHFDHPQSQAWNWARAVGADAAAIGGFDYKAEIAVGAPADLVLCRARHWTELMARPQADRIIVRNGRAIDAALPDYRELDDLME